MRVKAIDYSKKDYLRRHDWIISITDFENPTVTVTGRRYFLSGTHIIVPDSGSTPTAISCTALKGSYIVMP